MILIPVICPVCDHDKISKRGKTQLGKQRYLCQNLDFGHFWSLSRLESQ